MDLDGVTGREGIIHFKHEAGVTVVDQSRRHRLIAGKTFLDRASSKGRATA